MTRTQTAVAITLVLCRCAASKAVTIPTVGVGNPNNSADTRYVNSSTPDDAHPNGIGSVAYPFRIGMTEVTNAQYVAFLNAVAATDLYDLYSTSMESSTFGGIVRNGSAGAYSYAVKAPALSGMYGYENKPVAYVSVGDAMRFANWLSNGQPIGAEDATTTEDGAYTLNGATTDALLITVVRNARANWWLPNDDEWYKAAYYNATTGVYYDFATGTNNVPNHNLPPTDTGNSANFAIDFITSDGYSLTDVGAYALSHSPYGTFDQMGNVSEWNETLWGPYQRSRGGSWASPEDVLHASYWGHLFPTVEYGAGGFRVAEIAIPEPSTIALACIALGLFRQVAPAVESGRSRRR